jgi:hypothetical protein
LQGAADIAGLQGAALIDRRRCHLVSALPDRDKSALRRANARLSLVVVSLLAGVQFALLLFLLLF